MRASHPLLAFFLGAAPIFAVLALSPRPAPRGLGAVDLEEVRLALPDSPRWVAMVGGSEPSSTQVSLAQDAAALRRALGEGGALLFGGGSRGLVQVRDEDADPSLRARLAEIFDPRDRQVRYVMGPEADGPASAPAFFATMSALRSDDGPLTFVLAGHGEGGDIPADSVFYLWGGELLGVFDLAAELDALARPMRLVVTSCFGGGFADAMFVEARANGPLAEPLRCGVFATRFDHEASGCDPDPRRGVHEGYALHFWPALRGEDPRGARLEGVDLDGDGRVSLLEAHTHARVVSRSLDVPVTTSERWLEAQEEMRLDEGLEDPEGADDDAGAWAERPTPRRRGLTREDVPPELRAEARVIETLGELLDARNELAARGALARADEARRTALRAAD
ncbi:MAG: hypothetical protein KF901_13335, partial [Myxococcales bacterium]|nr:hypothetical protein [Myxococcales bacterium]